MFALQKFAELKPFYALVWANWGLTALYLAMITGNVFASRTPDGPNAGRVAGFQPWPVVATMATLFLVILLAWWRRRGQRHLAANLEGCAVRTTSERLRRRLEFWGTQLSAMLGARAPRIIVVPGSSSLAWTERSLPGGDGPLIVVTSTCWSASDADDLRATLTHEAGHVAARDVETFQRLLSAEWAVVVAGVAVLGAHVLRYGLLGSGSGLASFSFFIGTYIFAAVGVGCSWSALVLARELQADAFAAAATNDSLVRSFLQRRIDARRLESQPFPARVWRFIIQPNLAWRSTLPAIRGELGGRVEAQLGVGVSTTLAIGWWVAVFFGRYQPLNGFDLVLFAPSLALIGSSAYLFAWWRCRRSMHAGRSVFALALAWLRFAVPILIVTPMAVGLQAITGRGLRSNEGGWVENLAATTLLGAMLMASTMFVAAGAAVGHGVDRIRRREKPSIAGAVVGLAGSAVVGVLASVCGAAAALVVRVSTLASAFCMVGGFLVATAIVALVVQWIVAQRSIRRPNDGRIEHR